MRSVPFKAWAARSSSLALGVMVALVGGVGAVAVNPSSAAAACDPGRPGGGWPDYRWVGSGRSVSGPSYINGVKAAISYYDGFVYPWSPSLYLSTTSAWVQIVKPDTFPNDGWVKAGHTTRRVPGGGTEFRTFIHAKPRGYSTPSFFTTYAVALGSSPTYELRYNENQQYVGAIDVYRNGQALLSNILVGFGGPSAHPPDLAQASGQADMVQDQMPGATNAPVYFSDVNVRVNGSSTWQAFSGAAFNSNPVEYGLVGYSTSSFSIWDKKCTY
jgi:hypothetical protein